MSTISSQIVDAVVARLNESAGRPAGLATVIRCHLDRPQLVRAGKWIFVRTGPSELRPVDAIDAPIKQNDLRVIVDAIAAGGPATEGGADVPADVAVDPLVAWCTKQLDGWRPAGDLAQIVVETKRTPFYDNEDDFPLCRMQLEFLAFHTSRTGDAESRH